MDDQIIHGRISFGPMTADTGNASFTLTAGLDPSAAVIEAGPVSEDLPAVGDLVFSGTFGAWKISHCALLSPQVQFGPPPRVRYTVLDRRWRWKEGGGVFRGRFNWRRDTTRGTPWGRAQAEPLDNPKSPRELAALLFLELGEPDADVSAIPGDIPRSEWPLFEWDHLPTRLCLGQVLDAVRCRPIIGTDDRARVIRPGLGRPLNLDNWALDESHGQTPLIRPESLLFVGAPTVHEALVELEPVLQDLDGVWKPINDVSYRPAAGWENADLDGLDVEAEFDVSDIPDEFDQERARALATGLAQQIWRKYRLTQRFADGSGVIEGHIEQFEPSKAVLLPTLIGREVDAATGLEVDRQPFVEGEFYDDQHYLGNTPPGSRYRGSLSIDVENRLVTFGDPLYRLATHGVYEAARLFARVAFHYWEGETRIPRRFVDRLLLPGRRMGIGSALVLREDVEFRAYARYAPTKAPGEPYTAGEVQTNREDVQQAARYYLAAAARTYESGRTKVQTAIGLHRVDPDGRVLQVTWATNAGLPTTTAGEGVEHDTALPPYRSRRRQERQADRERSDAAESAPRGERPGRRSRTR